MRLLSDLLGIGKEATHLTVTQVTLRAVVMFVVALLVVRIADKRFFAKKTAFDVILGFILASMMARAINGSEQLLPTIAAAFAVALLHRFLGYLACRSPRLNEWLKGTSQTVITDGKIDRRVLDQHHIGEDDLMEELRLNGVANPDDVKLARLERSGEISVVKR